MDPLPITVLIPTIGRPALLAACLDTVTSCSPPAGEILVVDQSQDPAVAEVVANHAGAAARRIYCDRRGKSAGANLGLHQAAHELVLSTDDDCTVPPDWVGAAWRHLSTRPDTIVTGRVLAAGGSGEVPSTIGDLAERDYVGEPNCGALYWGNMACRAAGVLAMGGFDERIVPNAADNDLCYRWLRAGGTIQYRPDLVVWHHDWRSPDQMAELYVNYSVGQGVFYAKHLRKGDLTMCRFLLRDLYFGGRGLAAHYVKGKARSSDWRQGILRGLPRGLVQGWKRFSGDEESVTPAP